MKIGYIVNPAAGRKRVREWTAAIRSFTESMNFAYEIFITGCPKDGVEKGKVAIRNNCDIVVAVGGDGTVSEVVSAIKDSNVALGVLPVGTGNDFARSLGIPLDVEKALSCLFSGQRKTIDLGMVNDAYFINVASVGFDAQVVMEAQNIKGSIGGPPAYILAIFKALMNYRPFNIEIELDEGIERREAVLVAVANGAFYGGGMNIAPLADMNDGLLDVCLVNSLPRSKILRLFPLLFSGKHLLRPEVEYFKVKRMVVRCREGYINSDGEILGKCPASFQIMPNAVKVMVPRE